MPPADVSTTTLLIASLANDLVRYGVLSPSCANAAALKPAANKNVTIPFMVLIVCMHKTAARLDSLHGWGKFFQSSTHGALFRTRRHRQWHIRFHRYAEIGTAILIPGKRLRSRRSFIAATLVWLRIGVIQ